MQRNEFHAMKRARLLIAGLLALACGSEPLPPTNINITTAGGTISFLEGFLTIVVPAGAVAQDTFVSVRVVNDAPASPRLVTGTAVDLRPDGMVFLQPLTVKVDLGSRALPIGILPSELRIFKVIGGQWQSIAGSTLGATDGVVTAQISSFSTYGLLGVPVTSVVVAGSSPSVAIGGNATFTATARDAQSVILPERVVSWTSSNPAVATVSGSGVVVGVSAGSAIIKATSEGVEGSAIITVTSGGPAEIWLEEDFSSYASIENFLTNPRNIYTDLSAGSEGNEVFGRAQFTLENTGFGTLGKSLRFNFPDRTASAATRCQDYSIGVNLKTPTVTNELWLEVVAKYSAGFVTTTPAAWGCTSNPDHKFLFGRVTPTGRFGLHAGTGGGQWTFGYPGNEDNEFGFASSPFDGQWHTYRIHMKTSTTGTGVARFWFDGVLLKSLVNVSTTGQSIYGIAIGRNLNQGPAAAQSVTIGRVRIWNLDPGF